MPHEYVGKKLSENLIYFIPKPTSSVSGYRYKFEWKKEEKNKLTLHYTHEYEIVITFNEKRIITEIIQTFHGEIIAKNESINFYRPWDRLY
jgi:carboxylesterase type B